MPCALDTPGVVNVMVAPRDFKRTSRRRIRRSADGGVCGGQRWRL